MFSQIRPAKLCQGQCKSLHMVLIDPSQTGRLYAIAMENSDKSLKPVAHALLQSTKLSGQSEQGEHLGIRGNRVSSAPSGIVLSPLTPVLHVPDINISTNKNA